VRQLENQAGAKYHYRNQYVCEDHLSKTSSMINVRLMRRQLRVQEYFPTALGVDDFMAR